MSRRPAAEVVHSARNSPEPCWCGHTADQHYLNPPRGCTEGGCPCPGYGAMEAPIQATVPELSAVAVRLPIERIDSSPLNPRSHFDEQQLQDLAASLEADGLLQPIVVTPSADRYVIVAGERRWRAAKLLGWSEIPAIVRHDVDEATHIRLALLENLARTDLDPLEEAEGYRRLQDLGMTQSAIAAAVHRSQPAVANAIRLLKAPQQVQERLAAREISASHVLALLRYEAFPEALVKIAEIAAEKRTPSKELEKELSWEFTNALTSNKLIVGVSAAEFDRKVCEACPFGAYQGSGYSSYCFKPEHFRELQKAARAEKKLQVAAVLESASTDGKPALKLNSLRYGQYQQLYGNTPKGCTKACECRRTALEYGDRAVQICVKPARLHELQEAERQKEQADRRARVKALADACSQVLDPVESVRSRELVLVATWACKNLDPGVFNRVLAKHAPGLKAKTADFDDFGKLEPLQLVKIATEAVLSADIEQLTRYAAKTEYASWYAGATPKPKAKARKSSKSAVVEQEHAAVDELNDIFEQEAERELAGAMA